MTEQNTTQHPAESSPATSPAPEPEPEETEFQEPDLESLTPEQHAKWLEKGELPTPTKAGESAPPEKESEKATAESETAEKSTEHKEQTERKPHTAETRIRQLEADIAALKQQRAERIQALLDERRKLAQEVSQVGAIKPEPPAGAKPDAEKPKRPKMDEFEEYSSYEQALEEYEDKLTDWKVNQRIEAEKKAYQQQVQKQTVEQRNAQVRKNWEAHLGEAHKRHGDFEEVVRSVELPLNPVMDGFLLDSAIGPEIVYALCKNVAEAERIAKLSPFACTRELAKLESSISASLQAPQPKKVTEAKPPPTELSGTNRGAEDEAAAALEAGNFARYAEIMNQRDAARIMR